MIAGAGNFPSGELTVRSSLFDSTVADEKWAAVHGGLYVVERKAQKNFFWVNWSERGPNNSVLLRIGQFGGSKCYFLSKAVQFSINVRGSDVCCLGSRAIRKRRPSAETSYK